MTSNISRIRPGVLLALAMLVLSACSGSAGPAAPVSVVPPIGSNEAPTIGGTPPQMIKVGVNYSFTPSASDPDSDPLIFSIINKPDWANFDANTGRLYGIAPTGMEGTYNDVVISVSDGQAKTALPAFSVTVEAAATSNMPPVISGQTWKNALAGKDYYFRPDASDPDGDPLVFSIVNKPDWLSFNPDTGAIKGTPRNSDQGQYNNISITVSDGQTTSSLPAFTVVVSAAATTNRAPTISGSPDTAISVGEDYSFRPTASDPDDDVLTFSIQNKPSWAWFNQASGRIGGSAPIDCQ